MSQDIYEVYPVFHFPFLRSKWTVPSKKPPPSPARRRFGKNVAKLRRAAGLTQEFLAEAIDLSPRHMQSLEAGEYWPTLPTLRGLKMVLNVSWEILCDDKNG